jgi:threonine synthase
VLPWTATPLVRARRLERLFGLDALHLKLEGHNPTGSHKDRSAAAVVARAAEQGYTRVATATCGNYGVAIACAAARKGLKATLYVPGAYESDRAAEMHALGAQVVRTEGDYEAAVVESRAACAEDGAFDANPGGVSSPEQRGAFAALAREIVDHLGERLAALAVPVSNGTTLSGLYEAFVELGARNGLPRLLAGSTSGGNPIVAAHAAGFAQCRDLDPRALRVSPVNEPLVNWHAADGARALHAIEATGGWAAAADDGRLIELARLLEQDAGQRVLPAAAAGLAALLAPPPGQPALDGACVILVTARASAAADG